MIDTSLLLQAIAQHIATYDYQPLDYPEGINIKVVSQYPKSIADFADKRGVVVLADSGVSPPAGCDRVSTVQLRAICWAKDDPNARFIGDVVAQIIKDIPSTICMRGQSLTKSPIVDSIGPTSYQSESDLWFRAIGFKVRLAH
jgi:hypothetical protein